MYNDSKINKLAQENARYFLSVFVPMTFIYTTSLRQINYLVSWFQKYIENHENTTFAQKLSKYMQEFIEEIKKLNILDEELLKNEKHRSISIFGKDLRKKEKIFGEVYSTTYKGSFAQYAHIHRHRTLHYQLERMEKKEYFIPPIIQEDEKLVKEWLEDMEKVKDITPQGELVLIHEREYMNISC